MCSITLTETLTENGDNLPMLKIFKCNGSNLPQLPFKKINV